MPPYTLTNYRRRFAFYCFAVLALSAPGALAQTVLGTIPTGNTPLTLAVNPVTNKVYVTNIVGGTVSVIDGNSGSVASINASRRTTTVEVTKKLPMNIGEAKSPKNSVAGASLAMTCRSSKRARRRS